MTTKSLLALAISTLCAAPQLAAQCRKPAIPAAGLPTRTVLDEPFTYSDGYKTLVNLTLPASPAPSCAWPLVVHVHGLGGRRSVQPGIARRGYAVVTYDVRGQGDAKGLNPSTSGMSFYGATEKYDLAEIVAFARAKWAGLVSATELAVTGGSQGGIHSCFAAAYSGRTITIAGRGSVRFPDVSVVAPAAFIPDPLYHVVRARSLYAMDFLERAWSSTSAVLDPQLVQASKASFLAQDPAGFLATLEAEPGRATRPLLATCAVPMLFQMAWIDGVQQPTEALAMLRTIPATTPFQAMLSTGGHGSPANTHAAQRQYWERIRWFDRYLWGEDNGAGEEARYVLAAQPARFDELSDRTRVWPERHVDAVPPADVRFERFYLASGAALSPQPGAASSVAITHRVAQGFDAQSFVATRAQRSLGSVLAQVPLSAQRFRSAPTSTAVELCGSARVALTVTPSASRFHLAALLFAIVPGQSERSMLASWGKGVLAATPNVAQRFELELAPSTQLLPAGTSFELELRNHWVREAPMPVALVTAPYFVDCDTSVALGGASTLDLPLRPRVSATLTTRIVTTTAQRPNDLSMQLEGGAARAGALYVVLASLSGQAPGLALPGDHLRLQPDAVSDLMLQLAGGPIAPATVGLLDAQGAARPRFALSALQPLPPELVGARWTCAAWVFDAPTSFDGAATNPVDVAFR